MTETWKQWAGQVVNGEFRLQEYLGGSAHSAVFLTEKSGRGPQKAAIKLLPADPASAALQVSHSERIAKLSHPHLIRLFQAGRCELGGVALLYVVMEYAEENLSQILPQRPLTPAESREMLRPVLDVLAYLHGQGFVHGHLKPANILAVADVVKISSDGLCAANESRRDVRKIGVYEPPEAASGIVAPPGDVWSLGMTLVEAMTQRLPVWDAREHGEPSLPDGIPALFLDVARNSLRRDPQQRWTVAQIAERLQPVSPPPARVVTVPPRKTAAKWRYLVPAIAVGLVLLVVAGLRNGNRSPETESSAAVANEAPNAQQKPTPAVPAASRAARAASQPEVAATTPPAPAPSETAARTPKGNVVPGAVLHQVVPEASPSARNTITGKVRVRVKVTVDAAGNVTGATFDSPGPSKYFARLAMQAAPGWKFTPPQVNGRHVPSQWILRFAFGRSGTEVYQVQTAP